MSDLRTIGAVTTSSLADDPQPAAPIIVLVAAIFADVRSARHGAALLRDMWVDGDLDVLDGVLIHRAGDDASVRPVESVPRRAALPLPAWTDDLCGCPGRSAPTAGSSGGPVPSPAVGETAMYAFGVTARPDRVGARFATVDAGVSVRVVSAACYARLRRRPRPDDDRPTAIADHAR